MIIGIIGASSQVGSSLAFFFKRFTNYEVTCFVRSSYSEKFFDMLEIPYKQINLEDKIQLRKELKNFDVVLDFTYPTGQIYTIPDTIKSNINNIISSMAPGSTYIYMSSIMALGMPSERKYVKNFYIARTSYGYIKRLAEKVTFKYGRKYNIAAYNFRLGQVHGFLQSVNSSFREKLSQTQLAYIDGNSHEVTNTIFISSVANAIIRCAKKLELPGTYTLVSSPQWTLGDLYNYYLEYYNMDTTIQFIPAIRKAKKITISKSIFEIIKSRRYLFEIYLFMRAPLLSLKSKGKYRERNIMNAVNRQKYPVQYIDFNFLGNPPSQKIDLINSEVGLVFNLEKEWEAFYQELIIKCRV